MGGFTDISFFHVQKRNLDTCNILNLTLDLDRGTFDGLLDDLAKTHKPLSPPRIFSYWKSPAAYCAWASIRKAFLAMTPMYFFLYRGLAGGAWRFGNWIYVEKSVHDVPESGLQGIPLALQQVTAPGSGLNLLLIQKQLPKALESVGLRGR